MLKTIEEYLTKQRVAETGATGKIYDNPLHPYTRMLMSPVLRPDRNWEDVALAPMTRHAELDPGCVYCARCASAHKALGCEAVRPDLSEVEPDRHVGCYRQEGG